MYLKRRLEPSFLWGDVVILNWIKSMQRRINRQSVPLLLNCILFLFVYTVNNLCVEFFMNQNLIYIISLRSIMRILGFYKKLKTQRLCVSTLLAIIHNLIFLIKLPSTRRPHIWARLPTYIQSPGSNPSLSWADPRHVCEKDHNPNSKG